MGRIWTLVSCKMKIPEPILSKFVTVDYIGEASRQTKFGENPSAGVFRAKGWNTTFCVTYLFPIADAMRTVDLCMGHGCEDRLSSEVCISVQNALSSPMIAYSSRSAVHALRARNYKVFARISDRAVN